MGVNKDIGKAYNERLKNLEVTPNDNVWEKIQSTLETKKKTKVFPFWLRMIGAGLGILLLGGIIYKASVNDNTQSNSIKENENFIKNKTINPSDNNEILISDSNINNNDQINNKEEINDESSNTNIDSNSNSNQSSDVNNTTHQNSNNTNNSLYTNSKINTNKSKKTNLLNHNNINNSKNSVSNNNNANNIENELNKNTDNSTTSLIKNNSSINSNKNSSKELHIDSSKDNTITEKIDQNKNNQTLSTNNKNTNIKNEVDLEKELIKNLDSTFKKDTLLVAVKKDSIPKKKLPEKKSEWEVGAYIIPTYFGSFSKGSSLGEVLEDNDKQANITLSYRLLGNFVLSEKLTLRTGFGSNKLSYTTIDATNTDANGELENLGAFPGISYDFIELSEIYADDLLGTSNSVDFKQEITYFELPIELIYRIPKNKIEWKVFGGASVFKLSKNKIIAESSEGSYYIGGANNLSKYSYSVNLGGGLDYKVSPKVNLTVEPIFKYYINTFSRKTYNFKPISVGVSFGATYKF